MGHLSHSQQIVLNCCAPGAADEPDTPTFSDLVETGMATDIMKRVQEAGMVSEGIEQKMAVLETQNEQIMSEWETASATVNSIEAERDEVKAQLALFVEQLSATIISPLEHAQEMAADLSEMKAAALQASSRFTHTDLGMLAAPAWAKVPEASSAQGEVVGRRCS